jgi:hypothetical protein
MKTIISFCFLIVISANSFAGLTRMQNISEILLDNYFHNQCDAENEYDFGYSLIISSDDVVLRCYQDISYYRIVTKDVLLTSLFTNQINVNDLQKYVNPYINAFKPGDIVTD